MPSQTDVNLQWQSPGIQEEVPQAVHVPVSYIGKSVGSCASAKQSMRTAVRFPMAADFRYLNLGLAQSFARDLKGRASGDEGVSTAQGEAIRHRYIKPEYLYLLPFHAIHFKQLPEVFYSRHLSTLHAHFCKCKTFTYIDL